MSGSQHRDEETSPLLPSSHTSTGAGAGTSQSNGSPPHNHLIPFISGPEHKLTAHWNIHSLRHKRRHGGSGLAAASWISHPRTRTQQFLTSRWGHYFVLVLVGFDVACIIASFLITIFQLERKCDNGREGSRPKIDGRALNTAEEVFEYISLVISCLFLAELAASLWAFGFRYLKNWFHVLDATVIIAAFVLDVVLKGVIEEVGSVIVVLRLWRVFKIIEELSAGAEEQMDVANEHIDHLLAENKELRRRVAAATSHEQEEH